MSDYLDSRTISAMQTGSPVATYKKVILAKVHVFVLNSFTGIVEGLILEGEGDVETAMVDVWSEKEDVYFRKVNKKHFDVGNIIKYERPTEEPVKTLEQYSDDEIRDVVNSNYLVFKKILNEVKSEAVAQRILACARNEEKSEKVINLILAKISDLNLKRI